MNGCGYFEVLGVVIYQGLFLDAPAMVRANPGIGFHISAVVVRYFVSIAVDCIVASGVGGGTFGTIGWIHVGRLPIIHAQCIDIQLQCPRG